MRQLAVLSPQKLASFVEILDRVVWIWAALALALAALFLPVALPNLLSLTPYSAVWVLAGFAGISVTLLALLYAIATFRGQQLASRLPPALVGELLETRWHRGAFWRLLFVLVISLWTLAGIRSNWLPPSAQNVVVVDGILVILTIGSIRLGTVRVFDRDYPRTIASQILRRLDDHYLGERQARMGSFPPPSLASGVVTVQADPFALIEQTCVRAIAEQDLTTAHLVLRAVTAHVLSYLDGRQFVARGVLGWLGELLSVVGRKSLTLDERTGEVIVGHFERVLGWGMDHNLPWDDRIELLDSFRALRHAAIREKKTEVESQGLYSISRTFTRAVAVAPPEDRIWILHAKDPSPPPHNYEIDSEWRKIHEDWVSELGRDMDLLSAEDLSDAFRTGQFVHGHMIHDVIESTNLGSRQKRFLIGQVLWQSARVVLEAMRKSRGEAYVEWDFDWDVRRYDEQGLGDLVMQALTQWAEVVIAAARAGKLPWIMLNQFAAAGRGFAGEGRDDRAMAIAKAMGTLAAALLQHSDDEMRTRYLQAASGLRSLAEWDKRETSELKDVVKAELARYSNEDERLREWHESRRIPLNDTANRPWA